MMTNDNTDRDPATLRTMMRRQVLWWAVAVAAGTASGCKFDRPPALVDADPGAPDADPFDAQAADAETGCTPDTIVCDDAMGRYTECSNAGVVTLAIECPLGCAADVEKCLDLNPSNGLAAYLDEARSSGSAPAVTFAGSSTINTTTGVVFNGGVSVVVPTDIYNGMRVLTFDSIAMGGTLKVTGDLPLAIVALGDVVITGLVDVSADGSTPGPGATAAGATCVGGDVSSALAPVGGAGGGGRFQSGATGGSSFSGQSGAPGGGAARDDDLAPLVAGCRAGSSTYTGGTATTSAGGAGGGGIQIVSLTRIALTGSGAIDASGGGGQAASSGGAGGGSGGGVLLEAPQVTLDGASVVISAKGGGGSAANGVGNGADGGISAPAASGGTSGASPVGGPGGTESAAPGGGENGNSGGEGGGGGGGSVGQLRVNNSAAAINPQSGAAIRSRVTTGELPTRQVP